ncbi:MAG TPA: pyruvate dehydrogenase complex dihydrolipoamide acetyltransferase [Longimicrobiales bacterium]|nr:pyruvate dehydrogenase complex dihydrolipoamide acetyltransferase [Longimicrobiales bacterium]
MATRVHMEALSPTMEEGQLVKWLKSEGDDVAEGDVLAEIETDKATMELVARGSGVLRKIGLAEGGTASVGQLIAVIADADADIDELLSELTSGSSGGGQKAATGTDADDTAEDEDTDDEDEEAGNGEAASEPDDEAEETGKKPAAGGKRKAQPAKADGTDDADGKRKAQPAKADETDDADDAEEAEGAAEERGDGAAGGDGKTAGPSGRVKASPLARRLASESGISLASVSGSGPGGRIVKRDIEGAKSGARGTGSPAAVGPEYEDVPASQMRKAIAKRLVESIGPVPTFYLTVDVDMTRMLAARERANRVLEERGIKASINDYLIRAVAAALAAHPEVNASWRGDAIRRHNRVHIGVAVAIPDGLITPVIRDANLKGVGDIAAEVRELAGRAREKKLKPEEYTGATFSISNLGMFGIEEFTAIINPPEACILAVGQVEDRIVAIDGHAAVQPRMRMTMSCDHRAVDGATGARFLQTLRGMVEEPGLMVL